MMHDDRGGVRRRLEHSTVRPVLSEGPDSKTESYNLALGARVGTMPENRLLVNPPPNFWEPASSAFSSISVLFFVSHA